MHKQASVQSEEVQDTKLPSQQAQAGRRVRRNSGYHRACYTRNLPFTIHVISEPRAEPPRRPSADLITFGLETRLTWTGCRVRPVTAVSRAPERLVCILGCVRYCPYPRIRRLRSMAALSLILALSALWTGPIWGQDRSWAGSIDPVRISALRPYIHRNSYSWAGKLGAE